jgi:hypothetical protein
MNRYDWSDFILAAALTICCLMASCAGLRWEAGVSRGNLDDPKGRAFESHAVYFGVSGPLTRAEPIEIANWPTPPPITEPPAPPDAGEPVASFQGSVEEPLPAPGGAAGSVTGGGDADVGKTDAPPPLPCVEMVECGCCGVVFAAASGHLRPATDPEPPPAKSEWWENAAILAAISTFVLGALSLTMKALTGSWVGRKQKDAE